MNSSRSISPYERSVAAFLSLCSFVWASTAIAEPAKDLILTHNGSPTRYQVAFCFRPASLTKGTPGHAFLAIGEWTGHGSSLTLKIQGYGFYPESSSIRGILLGGPGEVKFPGVDQAVVASTRFLFQEQPSAEMLPEGSCRVLKHINQEQFRDLETLFARWNEEKYYLGGDGENGENCVTMVDQVTRSIGLTAPDRSSYRLPESYIKELWQLNSTIVSPIP